MKSRFYILTLLLSFITTGSVLFGNEKEVLTLRVSTSYDLIEDHSSSLFDELQTALVEIGAEDVKLLSTSAGEITIRFNSEKEEVDIKNALSSIGFDPTESNTGSSSTDAIYDLEFINSQNPNSNSGCAGNLISDQQSDYLRSYSYKYVSGVIPSSEDVLLFCVHHLSTKSIGILEIPISLQIQIPESRAGPFFS